MCCARAGDIIEYFHTTFGPVTHFRMSSEAASFSKQQKAFMAFGTMAAMHLPALTRSFNRMCSLSG
jgi:hypothetical protein